MQAEEAIKMIMENQFILDCPQMLLTPQLPASPQKSYSGPGFISQNDTGALTFKIFCKDGLSPFEGFKKYNNMIPGKIIGKEHYYSLSATDINGRQWEAKWIDPETDSGPAGSIVYSKIIELSHIYHIPKSVKGYFADIYFPGDIDIPCNRVSTVEKIIDGKRVSWSGNRNIAKVEACGFDFELEQRKNSLVFRVQSKSKKISTASIIRFNEALQFVLARFLSWAVLEQVHGHDVKITVKSLTKNDKRLVIGPPINLKQCIGNPNIVWNLFQTYLKHVIKYKKESYHPIFPSILKVIESESSSFEIRALVRSVAVEEILKSEFSEFKDIDSKVKAQVSRAIEIIMDSDLEDNFKERLKGSLGYMLKLRPQDYLHILKKQGLINEKLIKDYKKLRPKSAHGEAFSGIKRQEDVNQCSSVLVLIYHLIFIAIGYKGPYTDYSKYHFPLKDFGEGLG